jgi:hypothetical protein
MLRNLILALVLSVLVGIPSVAQAKDWYVILPQWRICAKTEPTLGSNVMVSPSNLITYLKSKGRDIQVISGSGPDGTGAVEVIDKSDNTILGFWGSMEACNSFLIDLEQHGDLNSPSGQ